MIADARVRPAYQTQGPSVDLELNARGAKIFDDLTAANVNRRLAIILDDSVYSAPVIQERIGGGRARRSAAASTSRKPATWRSCCAPAPCRRRWSSPRSAPSVRRSGRIRSVRACSRSPSGGALVLIFMLIYYKVAGLLADLA